MTWLIPAHEHSDISRKWDKLDGLRTDKESAAGFFVTTLSLLKFCCVGYDYGLCRWLEVCLEFYSKRVFIAQLDVRVLLPFCGVKIVEHSLPATSFPSSISDLEP